MIIDAAAAVNDYGRSKVRALLPACGPRAACRVQNTISGATSPARFSNRRLRGTRATADAHTHKQKHCPSHSFQSLTTMPEVLTGVKRVQHAKVYFLMMMMIEIAPSATHVNLETVRRR